jgi:hypothetical protein
MNIEFIEPRRPSRKAWLIAGILWVLVLMLGIMYVYLQSRVAHERDAQIAADAMAKTPPVTAAPRVVPRYQEEATAALKRAALPEADALAELEHVAVIGIQLRSIDVNPAAAVVVVELEATSDEVLGDYLDQLNAGVPASKWHIRRVGTFGEGQSSTTGLLPSVNSAVPTRSATIARDI